MKKCVSILIILLGGIGLYMRMMETWILSIKEKWLLISLRDNWIWGLLCQIECLRRWSGRVFLLGGRKKYSGYSSFLKTYLLRLDSLLPSAIEWFFADPHFLASREIDHLVEALLPGYKGWSLLRSRSGKVASLPWFARIEANHVFPYYRTSGCICFYGQPWHIGISCFALVNLLHNLRSWRNRRPLRIGFVLACSYWDETLNSQCHCLNLRNPSDKAQSRSLLKVNKSC